jgi:hypothetical protein
LRVTDFEGPEYHHLELGPLALAPDPHTREGEPSARRDASATWASARLRWVHSLTSPSEMHRGGAQRTVPVLLVGVLAAFAFALVHTLALRLLSTDERAGAQRAPLLAAGVLSLMIAATTLDLDSDVPRLGSHAAIVVATVVLVDGLVDTARVFLRTRETVGRAATYLLPVFSALWCGRGFLESAMELALRLLVFGVSLLISPEDGAGEMPSVGSIVHATLVLLAVATFLMQDLGTPALNRVSHWVFGLCCICIAVWPILHALVRSTPSSRGAPASQGGSPLSQYLDAAEGVALGGPPQWLFWPVAIGPLFPLYEIQKRPHQTGILTMLSLLVLILLYELLYVLPHCAVFTLRSSCFWGTTIASYMVMIAVIDCDMEWFGYLPRETARRRVPFWEPFIRVCLIAAPSLPIVILISVWCYGASPWEHRVLDRPATSSFTSFLVRILGAPSLQLYWKWAYGLLAGYKLSHHLAYNVPALRRSARWSQAGWFERAKLLRLRHQLQRIATLYCLHRMPDCPRGSWCDALQMAIVLTEVTLLLCTLWLRAVARWSSPNNRTLPGWFVFAARLFVWAIEAEMAGVLVMYAWPNLDLWQIMKP